MLNGLDLFSGIGGLTLALAPWARPVAYCENDRYAQSVLLSRMATGAIADAPLWDDVRTLSGKMLPSLDIIYGGFPCQDISAAGRGAGLDGERSKLVFEMLRLVGELRPGFVFMENVPRLRARGADVIIGRLAGLGYDCRFVTLSAASAGAEFAGERWFALAKARCERLQGLHQARGREHLQPFEAPLPEFKRETPPELVRGFDGIPHGVDRVKCLGNSVVPRQAREAFMRLSGLK